MNKQHFPKKISLFAFFITLLFISGSYKAASQEIPLVYEVENTGASFTKPEFSSIVDLPRVAPLTDPFEWSDGSGRSTDFNDWAKRRSEIKAEIENYEIGTKPPRPENISASFFSDTLTVKITENGNTLIIKSHVKLPEGDGPFPAVIGIGRGSGSLPAEIFSSRNIAQIAFNFSQVMSHTQTRGNEPINKLYPDLTNIGAYSAWPWGVSRLIDGLELVQSELNIDLKHLAVTGCSFAGKMALFSGAFDERIALTIAQESGGGGAPAWRVSETLGNVETLGRTNHAWFKEDMFKFSHFVDKLPHDHHELIAMVAPRAILLLGNPDYEWLAEESQYVSSRAAHEVWKTFGVPDRFGFSIVDGHGHCQLPQSQYPEVEAFVEKFLLGNSTVSTDVKIHPFEHVDYKRWFEWWGSDKPIIAPIKIDSSSIVAKFYEIECATYGEDWEIKLDEEASNGGYATVKTGLNSPDSATNNPQSIMSLSFDIEKDSTYYVFAKVNCPTGDDDSFWVQLNEQEFTMANGLGTNGWRWRQLAKFDLGAGSHKLNITYREDGAKIDQVSITNFVYGPEMLGTMDTPLKPCKPNPTNK